MPSDENSYWNCSNTLLYLFGVFYMGVRVYAAWQNGADMANPEKQRCGKL